MAGLKGPPRRVREITEAAIIGLRQSVHLKCMYSSGTGFQAGF